MRRAALFARLHRAGALLAVFALVLQMGASLAHQPIGLGPFAAWPGAALCHAGNGDRPVPAGAPAPADPAKSYTCPICILLQASAACFMPPVVDEIARGAPVPLPLSPRPAVVHLARAPGIVAQPRAPPAA